MDACAYVVGPAGGSAVALTEAAGAFGFAPVLPYAGVRAAERQADVTPLLFFLFAAVDDIETLRPAAEAIRFCADDKVRFSPLIYFARAASADVIRRAIGMGFDDLIAWPAATSAVVERLRRQLDTPALYYETSTYFGPDRRERSAGERGPDDRRGEGMCRRIEVRRSRESGISVTPT